MSERIESAVIAIEAALHEGGVLHTMARGLVEGGTELGPDDVVDVLNPKRPARADGSVDTPPRWQVVEGAPDELKRLTVQNAQAILSLAMAADIRRPESLPPELLRGVDRDNAVLIALGGANRTFAVRPALAETALTALNVPGPIFQFAGPRSIPVQRPNRDGELVDNAEYKVVAGLAKGGLPEGDATEYSAAVAIAEADDFEASADRVLGPKARARSLIHYGNRPGRELINPGQTTTEAGLDMLQREVDLTDMHPIFFTNGQYTTSTAMIVNAWARARKVHLGAEPIVFGDEPGFTVHRNDQFLTTAERAPGVYVPEFAVIWRLHRRAQQEQTAA